MYDFFDKHGKKFLAVVGSLLVLVFLMPGSMGRGGGVTRRYGTINGVQIQPDDVVEAQARFNSLSRLIVKNPDPQAGTNFMPLVKALFPAQVFGQLPEKLQQNPLLWYLLSKETETAGVSAEEQEIDFILNSPRVYYSDGGTLIAIKDLNPAVRDSFRPLLREISAVEKYYQRRRLSTKMTAPMIDDALAHQSEQIRVHVASFSADTFLPSIPGPTEDELHNQFNAFANNAPGVGRGANPFGFGYLIADKLRLQWIAVPQAEVARVIETSKPAEIWDEDAIIFYQKNPQLFQTTPAASPTTKPTAAPTTRPFAEARADVLKQLRQPLIEQQQHKIINRVIQQMTVDAQRAREQSPTTQQAADSATAFGVPFGSNEYLLKLADDIQKQFGVKLTTVNQGAPLTRIELQATSGIGSTTPDDISSAAAMNEVTGPAYLFDLCKPLMALADQARLGAFDLLQPTKVLKGDDALYVVRVLEAQPAHPPHGLDEVRAAVEKDVREKNAFSKAAEAAQALVTGASAAGGLEKVSGAKVQTSDWFGAESSDLTGVKNVDDAFDVVGPVFDQLRGVKSITELPRRTVIKRQAKGTALAVELFDVRTSLNTADLDKQRMQAISSTMQTLVSPVRDFQLVSDWFSLDGVSRRIGFVPDVAAAPTNPTQKAPPPGNPFLPG